MVQLDLSNYTLTVKTVSGTGLALPIGSTTVLYSDGTNITGKLQTKDITHHLQHTLQLMVIKF